MRSGTLYVLLRVARFRQCLWQQIVHQQSPLVCLWLEAKWLRTMDVMTKTMMMFDDDDDDDDKDDADDESGQARKGSAGRVLTRP